MARSNCAIRTVKNGHDNSSPKNQGRASRQQQREAVQAAISIHGYELLKKSVRSAKRRYELIKRRVRVAKRAVTKKEGTSY